MMATAAAASSGLGSSQHQECGATKPPCARVVPVPILSDNYAYLVIDVRLVYMWELHV